MKKCNCCNIEFNTNSKYCPLCQNILVGESNESMFPKDVRHKTNSLILKLALFGSLLISIVYGFVELLVLKKLVVTIYVAMGLITNYIVMTLIIRHYQNIYKVFGKYGVFIVCLLLIWYLVTKLKIITNFIIPLVCLFEFIFNIIIELILRRHKIIKNSKQLIVNIFLLLLPIVLVLLKQTTYNILAYICLLFAIIGLLGALIFSFNDVKEEFSKIFNI